MCTKHPKYKADRRPNAECLACWEMWLDAHPTEAVRARDLRRVLRLLTAETAVLRTWVKHHQCCPTAHHDW